jgi:hypothetical protein
MDRRVLRTAAVELKEHIVDRKKPSLTSPWKVGFLVALLLVVTSLGVSYFITGTFGVTWHWIHFGGVSPATWTFNPGAFIEEMAPLLVLTVVLAFCAYGLVAGAVRRYKSYVDSGAEYKQLLKSIRTIEDLEDEGVSERLRQHPELREFLMGLKHRIAAHEKNGDREHKHVHAAAPAERDDRPRLQSESAMLATAIANGREAFGRELSLTVPELKQIERAVRASFQKEPESVVAPVINASSGLEEMRAAVRTTAASLRRDVDECTSGAREMETALSALSASLQERPAAAPAPAANAATVEKRVDVTAEALSMLAEESRRIAIAAAMQATGSAGADAIKVAEELRTLATRFNTVAQHWRETAPQLKEILNGGAPAGNASPDGAAEVAASVTARARLWSERTIAMNEHVRALERAIHAGAEPANTEPARSSLPASTVDPAGDVASAAEAGSFTRTSDNFVAQNNAEMFGSEEETDATFVDVPGFEKERRFFAEGAPGPRMETADDRFVVDRVDDARWDLNEEPETAEPVSAAPVQSSHDHDGFLTGPRPVVSSQKIARPAAKPAAPAAAPEPVNEAPTATATLDPDADAVDLYELGAIDCVQTA